MILAISLMLVAFLLLRFLFISPKAIRTKGPMINNLFFWFQQVFYWSTLIAGLILAFYSSVRIGLIALGCFLLLYNASVFEMKWKAIPLLGNSLTQLLGLAIFLIGIVLLFVKSWRHGLFALAGCVVATIIMNIFMAIERSIIQQQLIEKEESIQPRNPPYSGTAAPNGASDPSR